jgi:hypothetical protein
MSLPTPHRGAQYRVVAANLHPDDIAEADRIVTLLRQAGWPRPTRSEVIRHGLQRLQEELADKTPEEIFRFFMEHRAR